MLRKTLLAIFKAIVLVLMSVSCFAQDTDANPQESKEILSGKKAAARGTPKPEADSADIPPFARGRIDEETYLRLRDELVATKRGVFDLIRDPQARLRGVLQMNQQEELMRRLQSNLKASQGVNGVIRPEFLFSTWSPLGPVTT